MNPRVMAALFVTFVVLVGTKGDAQTAQSFTDPVNGLSLDQAIAQGQMPDQVTAEAYENAVRDLETSAVGQAYVVARSNFEKLMARVNQQISEGMEKGATSSIITLG